MLVQTEVTPNPNSIKFLPGKTVSKKGSFEITKKDETQNELVKNLKANKERMLDLANEGYTTATDFADYLVQNNNLSFREAYKISARLVNYAEKKKKRLNELHFDEIKKIKKNLNKNVMKIFNVKNSVNLKTSYGGTATKNIKKMISKLKKEFK